MSFSVNYYPYQQAIKQPLDSLVSIMKRNRYTAISMHPESESNWNRTNVYRYLGFDRSLWKRDFAGAEGEFENYRMLQYNYLYDEAIGWGY